MEMTETQHILELSKDLLDDIELDRLPADKLILKANRLARLAGSDEIRSWLGFEMKGYNDTDTDKVCAKYMALTGRWSDIEARKGYFGPLGQQEALLQAKKADLDSSHLNNISGDAAFVTMRSVNDRRTTLTAHIMIIAGIKSRVQGLLHDFVSSVYYEKVFVDVVEKTFEGFKNDIDTLIAQEAGEVLLKFPSVVARLKEGDIEAVSQALVTCRRILEAFADAIFPASDDVFMIGDNKLKIDASKHQNRINAFIAQRTQSSSRRTRLRQNLANLFDRVSTGVHNEVTPDEAYALFLNVYLFLGEVLQLDDRSKVINLPQIG